MAMKSACMKGFPAGLRKGAWSAEEDKLLRKCIERFGEGKWHLVPLRAGLNRCRKSCRLRWLNYLEPSIKRGHFDADEIDLLVRLHRLLGNRWSLIAGRLPGRTANDVKNYWNTNLSKKKEPPASNTDNATAFRKLNNSNSKIMNLEATAKRTVLFKPRPRSLYKTHLLAERPGSRIPATSGDSNNNGNKSSSDEANQNGMAAGSPENGEVMWWESLFPENEDLIMGDDQGKPASWMDDELPFDITFPSIFQDAGE